MLKNLKVMVLSSLFEGLPNVLLESLSLKNLLSQLSGSILDYGRGGLLFQEEQK